MASFRVEFQIIRAGFLIIPKISTQLERAAAYVCEKDGGCACDEMERLQSHSHWSSIKKGLAECTHTVNLASQRKGESALARLYEKYWPNIWLASALR